MSGKKGDVFYTKISILGFVASFVPLPSALPEALSNVIRLLGLGLLCVGVIGLRWPPADKKRKTLDRVHLVQICVCAAGYLGIAAGAFYPFGPETSRSVVFLPCSFLILFSFYIPFLRRPGGGEPGGRREHRAAPTAKTPDRILPYFAILLGFFLVFLGVFQEEKVLSVALSVAGCGLVGGGMFLRNWPAEEWKKRKGQLESDHMAEILSLASGCLAFLFRVCLPLDPNVPLEDTAAALLTLAAAFLLINSERLARRRRQEAGKD